MIHETEKLISANDLLRLGDVGRCELIYGQLVMMSPAGFAHGEIAIRIARHLANFVEDNNLGAVLAAETGYLIETNPDLVRAPDVSFVRSDRLPTVSREKYFRGVPDLCVEVVSPDDTKGGTEREDEHVACTRNTIGMGCRSEAHGRDDLSDRTSLGHSVGKCRTSR